jgi:cell division initiation protein
MSDVHNRITPLDIKKKQFANAFRGYDVDEVETFLEMLTVEMEELLIKNQELRRTLEMQEKEIKEYKLRETSNRNTLESLQQILAEEKNRSQEKGKHIIREAEVRATEILMESRKEKSALENDVIHLKRMRREFLAKVGSLLDSYKKIIEQDEQTLDTEINLDTDVRMI